MDKLDRLLSHPMLTGQPANVLADIRKDLVRRSVPAGAHIFSKGGQPSGWFGLLEGEVAIVTSSPTGSEIVLTILSAGDWFGEVAILCDETNSHDAVARGNCELAFIPTTSFKQLLAREPKLYARFVALLARRVRFLVDIVEDFTTLPMSARLAKRVLTLAETDVAGSMVHRGRISQEEYALLVGATRQSVNQQFRRWERAGWIRIGYGGVEVIDREALRNEIAK